LLKHSKTSYQYICCEPFLGHHILKFSSFFFEETQKFVIMCQGRFWCLHPAYPPKCIIGLQSIYHAFHSAQIIPPNVSLQMPVVCNTVHCFVRGPLTTSRWLFYARLATVVTIFVLGPTSSKEHQYFIIGWNRGHQSGPIWYQSSWVKPTVHKHVLNMSYWITPNWVILNKLCS
jgi:hypothetical protein